MTRWLCIEATFLDGRYHGLRDGGEPDWPPAPHRLFQALVAAAHIGDRARDWSDAKAAAFRWLEAQTPPEILTPPASAASPFTLSVPNNDMDIVARAWTRGADPPKQPSELRTLKTLRPTALGGDAPVRYLWPISADAWPSAQPHVETLCGEARHLHHLGLGIDLAAGDGRVLDDVAKRMLQGVLWTPDASGRATRVPVSGSLVEILERHAAFLNRLAHGRVDPLAPPAIVRRVTYRRRAESRSRSVHLLHLVRADGAFATFDARKTVHVAAWVRHAAHESARRARMPETFIESFVCGHGESALAKARRLSYLPLPSVGHRHVDGRIRRALIVEPFDSRDDRVQSLARSMANRWLTDDSQRAVADIRAVPDWQADGVLASYLQLAKTWGSVTPIVLPGLDDRRSAKAIGLIAKALAQAEYTTPVEEILVQTEPVFAGADMAWRYFVPEYLRRWPRVHAVVTFSEAVVGPVAIGAGRHCGLGVFAALYPDPPEGPKGERLLQPPR